MPGHGAPFPHDTLMSVRQPACSAFSTAFSSSYQYRSLIVMLPARGSLPHASHTLQVIRTNDRILNIPTIDAACDGVERVCMDVQFAETVDYQESPTTWTQHTSSLRTQWRATSVEHSCLFAHGRRTCHVLHHGRSMTQQALGNALARAAPPVESVAVPAHFPLIDG
jgi:hypothetical protein